MATTEAHPDDTQATGLARTPTPAAGPSCAPAAWEDVAQDSEGARGGSSA